MSNTSTNRLVLKIDSDGRGAVETLNAINRAAETAGKTLSGLASGKTRLTDIFAVSPQTLASQKANINLLITEERGRAALARTATQESNARNAAARAVVQENNATAASVKILKEEANVRAAAARAAAAEARAEKAAEFKRTRSNVLSGAASNIASAAVGGVAGIAVTAATTAVAKSIKLASDSENALNQLQFQTRATGKEMEAASAKARELGADLSLPKTSSVDAAKAMLEMSKAGFNLQESMDSARGSLALAAAAEVDAGEAANITASLLKAFNLEGKEAGRVADLLAASANNSLGEITDVAQATQQASAVFHSARFTVGDLATDLAILANAGIKGSDAGTSLRVGLSKLVSPTDQARAEMKRLHLELYDGTGKLVSHDEVIRRVTKAVAGLSEKQRNNALSTIFGTDAVRAANIVFAAGVDKVEAMRAKVEQMGAASDTAAAKNKGLKGSLDGFNSTLDSFAEKYGSKFLDPLTSGVNKLSEIVGWMDKAIERTNRLSNGRDGKGFGGYFMQNMNDLYETGKAYNETLDKEDSKEGHAAQANIDIRELRAAKGKDLVSVSSEGVDLYKDLVEKAQRYNIDTDSESWNAMSADARRDMVIRAAQKVYTDFQENARIERLQKGAANDADGEKRRLEGRNAREDHGQTSSAPTRHVVTAEEEKAAEKARKAKERAERKEASERKRAISKAEREDEQKNALIAQMSAQNDRAIDNENRLLDQMFVAAAQSQQEAREAAVKDAQDTLKLLPTAKQIEALDAGKTAPDKFQSDLTKQIKDARADLAKASLDLLKADKAENLAAYSKAAARQPQDTDEAAQTRQGIASLAWQKANSATYKRYNERNTQADSDVERGNKEVAGALTSYAETVKQSTRQAADVIKAFWAGENRRIDEQMKEAEEQFDFAAQERLVQDRLRNQIEEASQDFYLALMDGNPAQVVEAMNKFGEATDEASDAMKDIKRRTQERIDAMGPKNEGVSRLRQQADPWARGRDRFFTDDRGNTRDRKRTDKDGIPRRVDGDQVQFMQDLIGAASKGSDDFLRALFSGKADKNTLQNIGKSLGQDFANAGADFLHRKLVDGPLNRLFDGIANHLQHALLKGGSGAGAAIGQAAMLLYAAYNLSGKAGKKKQRNTFAGMLAGAVIGSAAGNPLLGAELGATIGGSFANGGRYPTGRDILVGEKGPEIVRIDQPGQIIPNHKVGDYIDLRNLMPALPGGGGLLGGTPNLSSSAARTLQNVAATLAAGSTNGGAGYGDVSQSITIFGGVHGDKAVGRAGKTWGSSLQDAVAMR